MPKPARPVYLSPHLDDAVLSCGGLIHRQRQLHPLVITLFAGVPDCSVLSPFAADQHRRWGEPANPIAQRRREDAAALAHLGAACEHWDYLDCIYRQDPVSGEFLYTSEEALWGEVASADGWLVEELVLRLSQVVSPVIANEVKQSRLDGEQEMATAEYSLAITAQLYAPLAVGSHVDHQLVLRAALRLRRQGWFVQFYEDYPYAEDPQKLARALQSWPSPPSPTLVRLSAQDLAARIEAIRCNASQLANLFGDAEVMPARVQAYALAVGGGQGPAERYWLSREWAVESQES